MGFQYSNQRLQFFPQAEGYVNVLGNGLNEDQEIVYDYVYQFKDHLGNIRLNYVKSGNELKILEENHYYPFGLKHTYNYSKMSPILEAFNGTFVKRVVQVPNSGYQYKYNGKEWQDELGLNLYDYGARNYDPALGRWMNIDYLSEKYFSNSTYNYAGNNPVRFVDYDGNDFGISYKDGVITITQKWYTDGKAKTIDLLEKAIAYLNEMSGKYGLKTKDGTIIPINFSITFTTEKGEIVDNGFVNNHDTNRDIAENDNIANYLSGAGIELRNMNSNQDVLGVALKGGDDTQYCEDCNLYGETQYNATTGTIIHEMMHTLGVSHTGMGNSRRTLSVNAVGGILNYASANSKGFKVKVSNVVRGSFLDSNKNERVPKEDKPKVENTSPEKVKLNGTIVEIK